MPCMGQHVLGRIHCVQSKARGPPKCVLCSQAQAQSQAQAAARERGDVTRSPQDAAETWRRHIYVEGLYAEPMGMAGI